MKSKKKKVRKPEKKEEKVVQEEKKEEKVESEENPEGGDDSCTEEEQSSQTEVEEELEEEGLFVSVSKSAGHTVVRRKFWGTVEDNGQLTVAEDVVGRAASEIHLLCLTDPSLVVVETERSVGESWSENLKGRVEVRFLQEGQQQAVVGDVLSETADKLVLREAQGNKIVVERRHVVAVEQQTTVGRTHFRFSPSHEAVVKQQRVLFEGWWKVEAGLIFWEADHVVTVEASGDAVISLAAKIYNRTDLSLVNAVVSLSTATQSPAASGAPLRMPQQSYYGSFSNSKSKSISSSVFSKSNSHQQSALATAKADETVSFYQLPAAAITLPAEGARRVLLEQLRVPAAFVQKKLFVSLTTHHYELGRVKTSERLDGYVSNPSVSAVLDVELPSETTAHRIQPFAFGAVTLFERHQLRSHMSSHLTDMCSAPNGTLRIATPWENCAPGVVEVKKRRMNFSRTPAYVHEEFHVAITNHELLGAARIIVEENAYRHAVWHIGEASHVHHRMPTSLAAQGLFEFHLEVPIFEAVTLTYTIHYPPHIDTHQNNPNDPKSKPNDQQQSSSSAAAAAASSSTDSVSTSKAVTASSSSPSSSSWFGSMFSSK